MRRMHLTPFRIGALVGLLFALVGGLLIMGGQGDRVPGLERYGVRMFVAANWLSPFYILLLVGKIGNWGLAVAIALLGNAIVYGTIGWVVDLVLRWFRSTP
jgi:hypothetical protein